jgi:hypothetical protein
VEKKIAECFAEIGVPALVTTAAGGAGPSVNVWRDELGEFFEIRQTMRSPAYVIDCDPEDRHLLLALGPAWFDQSVFLCGHDERFWFAAAIPERARASTVQSAKDALKPQTVWDAMRERGVRSEDRDLRRTVAFVRQGEWFFIPRPGLKFDTGAVIRDQPLRREAGKPHVCQFMHRQERSRVYTSQWYPNGLTWPEVQALPQYERRVEWTAGFRSERVHVRGEIRHADHATIRLGCWHEVAMNTESTAAVWNARWSILRFRD